MKEIILSRNPKEKIYQLRSIEIAEEEFRIHEKLIDDFNEETDYIVVHYFVKQDDQEEVFIQCLRNSMDIIEYKDSRTCVFPSFC